MKKKNPTKFEDAMEKAIFLLARGETNQGVIYLHRAVLYLEKRMTKKKGGEAMPS